MPGQDQLAEFAAWVKQHRTADETVWSGTPAQIILDHPHLHAWFFSASA